MLKVESRVEQSIVLIVITHSAMRLVFDAIGDTFVSGCFGSLGRLELCGSLANFHNLAINSVAVPTWKDAGRLARVLVACLRERCNHESNCHQQKTSQPTQFLHRRPFCSWLILMRIVIPVQNTPTGVFDGLSRDDDELV